MEKRKINKNKITVLILLLLFLSITIMIIKIGSRINSKKTTEGVTKRIQNQVSTNAKANPNVELGWELTLVNYENKLPDNFKITLASIDEYRKFDNRAISYLKNMIIDMRKQKVGSIWVQSSYRSVEEQNKIYNAEVQKYMNMGKRKTEAQKLTEKTISKPRI